MPYTNAGRVFPKNSLRQKLEVTANWVMGPLEEPIVHILLKILDFTGISLTPIWGQVAFSLMADLKSTARIVFIAYPRTCYCSDVARKTELIIVNMVRHPRQGRPSRLCDDRFHVVSLAAL